MKGLIKYQSGFTFIEIILAIALIGIIAAGLLSGIKFAMEGLYASKYYMQKNYSNQGEMEEFIAKGTTTETTSTQTLTITWQSGPVPNFSVSGTRLDKPANSSYLHETIKVLYLDPTSITP